MQHDAAHPFTVKAGDYQIRDLGTRFEVSREGERVIVSVAEGQVEVGGHGITPLTGLPGDRITISHGTATRSHVDPTIVASWRDGRLIYADAPLAMVIADINRYAAKPVALSPALADRHFSGVLTIGDGSQLARNLAEVLAVPITDTPDGQRLGAGGAD